MTLCTAMSDYRLAISLCDLQLQMHWRPCIVLYCIVLYCIVLSLVHVLFCNTCIISPFNRFFFNSHDLIVESLYFISIYIRVNSRELRRVVDEAIESAEVKPNMIRFFRGAMFNMVSLSNVYQNLSLSLFFSQSNFISKISERLHIAETL